MASISNYSPSGLGGQSIAHIVGFTCLFGFLADMVALALAHCGRGRLAR